MSSRRPARRFVLTGIVIAVAALFAAATWPPAGVMAPECRLRHNAAWISVDWTSNPVNAVSIQEMVERAGERHIRYLFPYTTYLKQNGDFNPTFDYAAEFVATVKQQNPDITLLAWIGVPLANSQPFGVQGWVDLTNAATRRSIAALASDLVHDIGFAGVHLNVETVHNDNEAFLLLLEEVKQAIGTESILSVAGAHWQPDWSQPILGLGSLRWDGAYYREVAARVDQIATMTYDSFMPLPALYRWWVREEVKGLIDAGVDRSTDLFIGLSVSRAATASHNPSAESLQDGFAGVCAALKGSDHNIQGFAIYADWEFSDEDQGVWGRMTN